MFGRDNIGYYQPAQIENAMAIVAGWIADDHGIRVNYHDGQRVAADLKKRILHIPHVATASGITGDCLELLRGNVYHEAGHLIESSLEVSKIPQGHLHSVWNALEDRRMERIIGDRYLGCGQSFLWKTNYYNRKITEDLGEDTPQDRFKKTVWEALVFMGMQIVGVDPLWAPTPIVRKLVDAAYDEFSTVYQCKDVYECIELAKRILKIFMDILGEEMSQQDKGEGQQGGSSDGEESEGQQSGSSDGEESEGQQGEGSGKDEGEEGDEEGDKEGQQDESDEDGEDESEEEGNEGLSGDEGEDSEDGEEQSKDNKPSGDKQEYKPNTTEVDGDGEEFDMDIFAAFEDEISIDDLQEEELKKVVESLNPMDLSYTSDKSHDEHVIPETDRNRELERYKMLHEEISSEVMFLSRELQQALRSMSRKRKKPYQQFGKIDKRRMVQIARNTSREVYYTTKNGFNLDTCLAIIMDESGSMNTYQTVQKVVAAVSESISGKVPFMIVGTTTKYSAGNAPSRGCFSRTNPIVYKYYKTFGEQWDTVRQRVTNISRWNHNIDGEVIENVAHILQARPESRKVILSICDGMPMAGHDNDREMGENLKRVCNRTRQQGFEVYGFGIDTAYPAHYYGEDWFVRLDGSKMDAPFVRRFADIVTRGRFSR